jgi:hypothetical protein
MKSPFFSILALLVGCGQGEEKMKTGQGRRRTQSSIEAYGCDAEKHGTGA